MRLLYVLLPSFALFINNHTSFDKFYSFITFKLLINDLIKLALIRNMLTIWLLSMCCILYIVKLKQLGVQSGETFFERDASVPQVSGQ